MKYYDIYVDNKLILAKRSMDEMIELLSIIEAFDFNQIIIKRSLGM